MTKLAEWLIGAITFITIWYNLLIGALPTPSFLTQEQILWSPVVIVLVVGVLVLLTLVHRVRTFKTCPESAEELKRQIKQAREDLASKGFKFD